MTKGKVINSSNLTIENVHSIEKSMSSNYHTVKNSQQAQQNQVSIINYGTNYVNPVDSPVTSEDEIELETGKLFQILDTDTWTSSEDEPSASASEYWTQLNKLLQSFCDHLQLTSVPLPKNTRPHHVYLEFGSTKFCWPIKDFTIFSLTLDHKGEVKTLCVVPQDFSEKFEDFRLSYGRKQNLKSNDLDHVITNRIGQNSKSKAVTNLAPNELYTVGIPTIEKERNHKIPFPGGYHQTLDYSQSEASKFAALPWPSLAPNLAQESSARSSMNSKEQFMVLPEVQEQVKEQQQDELEGEFKKIYNRVTKDVIYTDKNQRFNVKEILALLSQLNIDKIDEFFNTIKNTSTRSSSRTLSVETLIENEQSHANLDEPPTTPYFSHLTLPPPSASSPNAVPAPTSAPTSILEPTPTPFVQPYLQSLTPIMKTDTSDGSPPPPISDYAISLLELLDGDNLLPLMSPATVSHCLMATSNESSTPSDIPLITLDSTNSRQKTSHSTSHTPANSTSTQSNFFICCKNSGKVGAKSIWKSTQVDQTNIMKRRNWSGTKIGSNFDSPSKEPNYKRCQIFLTPTPQTSASASEPAPNENCGADPYQFDGVSGSFEPFSDLPYQAVYGGFECMDCGKRFRWKRNCVDHILIVHRKAMTKKHTVKCHECQKNFYHVSNLNRHMRNFHGFKSTAKTTSTTSQLTMEI